MCANETRVCIDCAQTSPMGDFPLVKGMRLTTCRKCTKARKREAKKRTKARTLANVESEAVAAFTAAASTGGENIPHSCELLERVMEYFGGVTGFSSLLVKQYFDAPPGSSQRGKVLEAVMRLVVKNTDQGGSKKPLGQWTDDELESELDVRLKTIAAQYQGRIVDGTFSEKASEEAPSIAAAAAIAVGLPLELVSSGPASRDPGRAG